MVWAVDEGRGSAYAPLLDGNGSSSEGGGSGGGGGFTRGRSGSDKNFGLGRRESNSSTDSLSDSR